MKISAIIPTFNEEDHIIAAIESLAWADEIIVVDSFSTDNTVALAQSKGVKILQRNYEYSASQKNWAIPQASYDWVFILDADERVKDNLKKDNNAWGPGKGPFLKRSGENARNNSNPSAFSSLDKMTYALLASSKFVLSETSPTSPTACFNVAPWFMNAVPA